MSPVATFLFSLIVSYLVTVLLLRVRLDRRFVDVPNERSSHETPKPRFGGIAIAATFLVVALFWFVIDPDVRVFLPLLLGGTIVFVTGVVDDWRSLHVSVRFMAQGAAAVIVVGFGNVIDHIYLPMGGTFELGIMAVPFTVIFILTSINFYNFIDGIDGLAAGSAVIVAGFLGLIANMLGHEAMTLVCLAIAGSTLGFLQFNLPPSKLFMGDSGSTFLGFAFAYVAIAGNGLVPEIPLFIPVLMLSALYVDAGLTLLLRAVRGEKVLQAHHMHYYQRLLSLGLNHKQVTALEYGLTILLGISAVVYFVAGGLFPAFLTVCWVVVFAGLILKIRSLERGDRAFWERRTVMVIAGDILFIALAYFGAYFLRMNFRFTEAEGMAVLKAFPMVLVVRSVCFYYYGLYRGVWKYTSTPDVLRIIKAVTAGSAIIVLLLVFFYRFVAFPRSLFILEYFFLIIALGGSRFASRLFHEFGKEALSGHVKRIAIIGAGDYGERLGREIRSTQGRNVSLVCFVDDDEEKTGLIQQGVPIRGPISNLEAICKRHDIDALVLGISSVSDERLQVIIGLARRAGVPIEMQEGEYVVRSEPAPILFDRISRGAAREFALAPQEKTMSFFEGKRVLVTHGGERLGPRLVRSLLQCDARVTVQVASSWEGGRFSDIENDGLDMWIGSIERDIDVARLLKDARPQVVFHCTDPGLHPSTNRDDYLRRRFVRTTAAITKTAPSYPIESLILMGLWGDEAPDGRVAGLSAAAEVFVLNAEGMTALSPKVIRVPRFLNENELRAIQKQPRSVEQFDGHPYTLLEPEVTAMALNVAASYATRAIVVPKVETELTVQAVHRLIHQANIEGAMRSPAVTDRTPRFPNEELKASLLPGLREVVSPIYPASDDLVSAASRLQIASEPESVESALRWVRSLLVDTPAQKMKASGK